MGHPCLSGCLYDYNLAPIPLEIFFETPFMQALVYLKNGDYILKVILSYLLDRIISQKLITLR